MLVLKKVLVRPLCLNVLNTKRNCQILHGRYGVLCGPFGLEHSATDRWYPHLSLCGANSFCIFFYLDHSASQPFICELMQLVNMLLCITIIVDTE